MLVYLLLAALIEQPAVAALKYPTAPAANAALTSLNQQVLAAVIAVNHLENAGVAGRFAPVAVSG